MAFPISLLIAVEQLKQGENTVLRQFQRLHSPTVNVALIDAAVAQVATDRIAFARDFVGSAKRLPAGSPSQIDYRNATSRAYYAIHHALRAVLLFDLKADTYGHTEAIDDFMDRVNASPALRSKAGLAGITRRDLLGALHWRHLADYHYYGSSEPFETPVNFAVVVQQALALSEATVNRMEEYIRDRIAGVY